MERSGNDHRWVALARPKWWASIIVLNPLILTFLTISSFNVMIVFLRYFPPVWWIAIMIAVAAAVLALTLAINRLAYPQAYLNPSISTIRAGRHRAHYSDITSAKLLVITSKPRRTLNLLFRSGNGLRAVVLIRDAQQRTLDHDVAALIQDMLRQSSIAMPKSAYDPSGKFARFNFPDYITLKEANELVAHPPAFDEPLPTAPRV